MDCSPPGSSVHGISQARILEWVAISFSRGSSQPRDQTKSSASPAVQEDSLPLNPVIITNATLFGNPKHNSYYLLSSTGYKVFGFHTFLLGQPAFLREGCKGNLVLKSEKYKAILEGAVKYKRNGI